MAEKKKKEELPEEMEEQEKKKADTHQRQIETSGGAYTYVGGDVSKGGGTFIGRDKTVWGDEIHGDKVMGDQVGGDKISIGDISGSNVAMGRQAQVNVQGDSYSGDFRGAILNVRSTLKKVSQGIGALPKASDGEKAELKQLVAELEKALAQAMEDAPEKANDAEAVAQMTEQLLNTAAAEKPNQTMLKITGEGLKQAAENIAAVMPVVLQIATQIVTVVGAFAN